MLYIIFSQSREQHSCGLTPTGATR